MFSMEYTPVRVSTLRGDQKIDFDLYVKLPTKYIHYAREGSQFNKERIIRLKEKKVRKLYIPADQEELYQNYISLNLDNAFSKDSSASVESRAHIAQGMTQASVEEVFEDPGSESAYNHAKEVTKKYTDFLLSNDKALSSIMEIQNTDKDLAHHCTRVASLSVNLAIEIGLSDKKQLELLALGASLHDFGLYDTDLNWQRPTSEMTPEELALYKEHPKKGAESLQDKKHLDQAVITIIMEHEELGNGKGFPQGLQDKKIDRLAKIVGLCNLYDRLVTFEGRSDEEAIKQMAFDSVGSFPLENINALKKILKSL